MGYGSDEDITREYEMIATLFSLDEEQQQDPSCACKEGIVARVFKFLFGTIEDPDDCDSYHEKRPYHRHIHQPSRRAKPASGPIGSQHTGSASTSSEDQWARKRLSSENALMAPPPLGMPPPMYGQGFTPSPPPQPYCTHSKTPLAERLLRVIAALTMGAALLLLTFTGNTLASLKSYMEDVKNE